MKNKTECSFLMSFSPDAKIEYLFNLFLVNKVFMESTHIL